MIDMTRLGLNLFTISMEIIKIILKIMLYLSQKKKKKLWYKNSMKDP